MTMVWLVAPRSALHARASLAVCAAPVVALGCSRVARLSSRRPPGYPGPVDARGRLPRAWYQASLQEFLSADPLAILGALTARSASFAVEAAQTQAWRSQIELLRESLPAGTSGSLLFEFEIPRMGRRIDAVLLLGEAVVVLEFKFGESRFAPAALEQVWDYALDLKNFHDGSHDRPIIPVLIAGEARTPDSPGLPAPEFAPDRVGRPIALAPAGLPRLLTGILQAASGIADRDWFTAWIDAPYRPTPTIVEAARALYARHSVDAIARHDAGARNLQRTAARLDELVDEARAHCRKLICFVTGVPGAGKTLVGLNLATRRRDEQDPTHAVFLSGNGPLVAVLREALTRDDLARRRLHGERTTKGKVGKCVKAFIQNVHHFRDEALHHPGPPADHVVIFDEAQRAWNRHQTARFMRQKKGQAVFDQSEPEFLIRYMDRHADWAVIVCLVGGGQEIHTGEAGIAEWLRAATTYFPHWQLHVSSQLVDSEYAAGRALDAVRGLANVHLDDDALHLHVSMRSFRAEHVSHFVKALLDCDRASAGAALTSLRDRYPVVVTRDLARAKRWVRDQARGSERFGLLASSRAMRLKPYAIDVRVTVDPVKWFLNDRDDIRSSWYLEDCATEFQVQGLELDWTCVTWDGDLRFCPAATDWSYHDFRGSRWQQIRDPEARAHLKNAYRVLLTRARQGMVLCVPPGDEADPTRPPAQYDATFEYLRELGMPVI